MEKINHKYEECKRGHQLKDGRIDKKSHCGWCGDLKKEHEKNNKIQKKKASN